MKRSGQDKYFRGVTAAIERVFVVDGQAGSAYERAVRDILDRNRLEPGQTQVEIVLTESLEDILQPSFYQDFIPAAHRFGTAGVGGTAAGAGVVWIVAQKVTAKMVGKSLTKLAAKALVKALASKVGTGAVAGGVAGSVVPVAGTIVGAVVGIFAAVVGGVVIDGVLVQLEEVLGRDDFKRKIVAAIRETREEFEDQYLGTPSYSNSSIP